MDISSPPLMTYLTDCYVYTFASSLDGKVFYIGKGTRGRYGQDRIRSHLQAASGKRIKISRVDQRIREIWQHGGKVIIRKPYNRLTDLEANRVEQELTVQYGYTFLLNQDWHRCHKNQWHPPKGKRNGW